MNVLFKRGLSAGLPTSGAIEGAFYLTTDTNRLYIGKNLGTENNPNVVPVELNQSITIKNNLAEAQTFTDALDPEAKKHGQFFYLAQENILAVYKDNQWVQINPDTNTNDNTKIVASGIQAMINDSDSSNPVTIPDTVKSHFIYKGMSNGIAKYQLVLSQSTSHIGQTATNEADVVLNLDIDTSELVAGSTSVGINASAPEGANSTVTVSTVGAGSDNTQKFTVSAGDNVTIGGNANALTISATDTQYEMQKSAGSTDLSLKVKGGAVQDTINFTDDDVIVVTGTNANELKFSHADVNSNVGTYGPTENPSPAAGGTFSVPTITVDAKGHITAAAEKTVTLPAAANDYISTISADNTGVITIQENGRSPVKSKADLYYTIGQADEKGNVTTAKVLNQNGLGTYYTKDAIDKKLQGLNAMTYKGTVFGDGATVATLPTTGVQAGDSYKATADSDEYKNGDLIIATGKEGADGTLSNITWTRVPAGDDVDTTYSFSVDGTTLKYTPSTGTATTYAEIVGGNELTANGSGTTITINHDTSGVTAGSKGLNADATPSAGGTFKVPYITVNKYGHVTGLAEHEVTLPEADAGYTWKQDSKAPTKIILKHGSSNVDDVTWINGEHTSVTGNATNKTIQINHTAPVANAATDIHAGPSANATPAYGGSFTVPEIVYDTLGHIVSHTNRTVQIPESDDTTYTLTSAAPSVAAGTTGITLNLDASKGTDSNVTITSTSLKLSHSENTTTHAAIDTIDIEWGNF